MCVCVHIYVHKPFLIPYTPYPLSVATPTAVVLMAINSMVAYAYSAAAGGVDAELYRLTQVSHFYTLMGI
jgi:hypothetical protein